MVELHNQLGLNANKTIKHKIQIFLLFMYISITPLSMVTISKDGSAMKDISILVFIIGFINLFREKVIIKTNNRLALAWTAYAIYSFLGIFWSTNFDLSFQTGIGLLEVLGISLLLAKCYLSESDTKTIEFACIFASIICLLLFFGGAGQQAEFGQRTTIVLKYGGADPNEFCAYFYMPLAIITVRLLKNKSIFSRLMCFIYIMVVFYCILLTGSRGGLLAAIATLLISFLYSTSFSFKKIVILIILSCLAYITFSHFIIPNVPQPILERMQLQSLISDKGSDRAIIWETALTNIFSGTPRLIYGYGPFGIIFMRNTMHNQFIQVLMDEGVIGLGIYLWFAIELIRKAYLNGPAYLGGIIGAFVALMSLSGYGSFKPIWIIFLMCLLNFSIIGKSKIIP